MAQTIQHKLQQFDPGIVWLDDRNIIVGMNSVAAEVLGDRSGQLIGEEVLSIHPERSREKVRFLLEQANCPVDSPPPVAMMINIPERVLLIKVSKMSGREGPIGACMVFYDVTELAAEPPVPEAAETGTGFSLFKLPVYKHKQVLLVDVEELACIKADGHYSTLYAARETYLCNLSVSDLEAKIRLDHFVRVHRSYIVNMRFAKSFEKLDEHRCFLVMDHGDEGLRVPISRPNVAKIKAMLGLR